MKYYLSTKADVTGPFTREILEDSFRSGAIDSTAQICEAGSESWQPIQNLLAAVDGGTGFSLATVPSGQQEVHVHNTYIQPKSPGIAVLLEVLPGVFFQTFGIGNMYAGNVMTGLVLMFTYWAAMIVNIVLMYALIGFITWPITFIAYIAIAVVTANNAASRENQRMMQVCS